jgi:ribosomal protein L12E/L44/L45/RPP1/RPP2
MADSDEDDDDYNVVVKNKKLETENDTLKEQVKILVGQCKSLKKQLSTATEKMVNMAACGKQGKSSRAETNLQAAKKGK